MAAGLLGALALSGCATVSDPDPDPDPAPASAVPGDPVAPAGAFEARVERVVDGDTFLAHVRGQRLRVRLIGVDAPESVKPDAPVECGGAEASAVLAGLLPSGAAVRAAYQPGGRRDRFGRELWDVWLADGRFLQAVLVRRGAVEAVAYPPQVAHDDLLESLEDRARTQRRGLFGRCQS